MLTVHSTHAAGTDEVPWASQCSASLFVGKGISPPKSELTKIPPRWKRKGWTSLFLLTPISLCLDFKHSRAVCHLRCSCSLLMLVKTKTFLHHSQQTQCTVPPSIHSLWNGVYHITVWSSSSCKRRYANKQPTVRLEASLVNELTVLPRQTCSRSFQSRGQMLKRFSGINFFNFAFLASTFTTVHSVTGSKSGAAIL